MKDYKAFRRKVRQIEKEYKLKENELWYQREKDNHQAYVRTHSYSEPDWLEWERAGIYIREANPRTLAFLRLQDAAHTKWAEGLARIEQERDYAMVEAYGTIIMGID